MFPISTKVKVEWLIIAVISFLILILGNTPDTIFPFHISVHIQMMALVYGLVTYCYAFTDQKLQLSLNRSHLPIIIIVLIGFVIRIYNLDHIFRNYFDELSFMANINFIEFDTTMLLTPRQNAFTNVFPYLQYVAKLIFGPGLFSLRLPSAIFGTLGVLGVYLLVKQFLPRNIALLSAFILATLPLHIHFSRIGLNNVAGSTLGIWGFICVLQGFKNNRSVFFAVGGVLFGLTHYFYEIDRLFFMPFFVLWIVWLYGVNRQQITDLKLVILCVVTAGVVALPVYYTLMVHGYPIFERVTETEQQIANINFNLFNQYLQVVVDDTFYRSTNPSVPYVFAPFFVIGFCYLVVKIRTQVGSLIVGILVFMVIGNGLVLDTFSPLSPRYVNAYVAISITISAGVYCIVYVLGNRLTKVLLLVVIVLGISQVYYYFSVSVKMFYEDQFARQNRFGEPLPFLDEMILRFMEFEEETTLHIINNSALPGEIFVTIPVYYGKYDLLKVLLVPKHELEAHLEEIDKTQNNVFVFSGHDYEVEFVIRQYFTITEIEETAFPAPKVNKLRFYHTQPVDE